MRCECLRARIRAGTCKISIACRLAILTRSIFSYRYRLYVLAMRVNAVNEQLAFLRGIKPNPAGGGAVPEEKGNRGEDRQKLNLRHLHYLHSRPFYVVKVLPHTQRGKSKRYVTAHKVARASA